MLQLDGIISDRGSKYSVSGMQVSCRADCDAFLKDLKCSKRFARATHNTWAAILPDGGVKADDGEAGAGAAILRMMEREGVADHIIVVTRWYGGVKLGGDRFRHVSEAVRLYLAALRKEPAAG